MTARNIEVLKSDSRFVHAGALAFILGHDCSYGCHYGMRSTRNRAIELFTAGFVSAKNDYETFSK